MNKNLFPFLLCLLSSTIVVSQVNSVPEDELYEDSILHSTTNSGQHHTLSNAVVATDLYQVLNSDGPFTVFAPSDEAFDKLPVNKIKDLLRPQNKSELQSLIAYHIVAGRFTASKILKAMCRGGGEACLTTVQGNVLTAKMDGIDIVLVDDFGNEAKITTADEDRCNGIIHIIDTVVVPNKI